MTGCTNSPPIAEPRTILAALEPEKKGGNGTERVWGIKTIRNSKDATPVPRLSLGIHTGFPVERHDILKTEQDEVGSEKNKNGNTDTLESYNADVPDWLSGRRRLEGLTRSL